MRTTLSTGTEAELAHPARRASDMGLVVMPDVWGLRPLYDDMCQRLADAWSMSVCAVDPFPGMTGLGDDLDGRWRALNDVDDDARFADFLAAADATGHERVGAIGFCLGGMYTLKAAALDRFVRLVSFYGMIRVPTSGKGAGHGEPLELIAAGHPERLLAIIGDRDPYTPPEDVAALEALGVRTVHYPDAEHGFVHDPDRPAHRADDAADAWQRCKSWLRG